VTRAGAREVLNVIRAEAITILFAFPALLRSVIPVDGERAGKALRLVRIGGDTTLWSDIDRLRDWLAPDAAIQSIYAATEAPMMQWFVDVSRRDDDPRIPIGYPLPGNRLALIDEDGNNTLRWEAGELIVRSPYVALGLWANGRCVADSTEHNSIGDNGIEGTGTENKGAPASRLFRTGDLVRERPDGLLERMCGSGRPARPRRLLPSPRHTSSRRVPRSCAGYW
jgi:non-ribosomal peptide synthetase component F